MHLTREPCHLPSHPHHRLKYEATTAVEGLEMDPPVPVDRPQPTKTRETDLSRVLFGQYPFPFVQKRHSGCGRVARIRIKPETFTDGFTIPKE